MSKYDPYTFQASAEQKRRWICGCAAGAGYVSAQPRFSRESDPFPEGDRCVPAGSPNRSKT